MSYPKSTWRLILSPPADGAWNMAIDEAILEGIANSATPTTLRLYAWEPPCLSLGYAQPCSDADRESLQRLGWDLVRRPTGGRAILHTDELTYSVIGSHGEPRLSGGVLESYQVLSQALLRALHNMDLPAEAIALPEIPQGFEPKGPICFEVPSNFEITVQGKKLVGSAQARKKEGILQHGSLPLNGDLARITNVLSFPSETARRNAATRLLTRATTVAEVLGTKIPWNALEHAFISAFEQSLNIDLEQDDLTTQERSRAQELVREKYGNVNWTARVP